jgi:phosphoribosylamine-glycine ligase
MAEMKNGLPTKWVYNFQEKDALKTNVKYFKGLGAWKTPALKVVVKKDGLPKMIDILEYDEKAEETIDKWLNGKRADDRKTMILDNEFDLIKV